MKYSYFIRPYALANRDLEQFAEQSFDSYEAAIWALKDAGVDVTDESIAFDKTARRKIEIIALGKDPEDNSIGALPTIYLYY